MGALPYINIIKRLYVLEVLYPKWSEELWEAAGLPVQIERTIREHDQACHNGQAGNGEHERWVIVINLLLCGQTQTQRSASIHKYLINLQCTNVYLPYAFINTLNTTFLFYFSFVDTSLSFIYYCGIIHLTLTYPSSKIQLVQTINFMTHLWTVSEKSTTTFCWISCSSTLFTGTIALT